MQEELDTRLRDLFFSLVVSKRVFFLYPNGLSTHPTLDATRLQHQAISYLSTNAAVAQVKGTYIFTDPGY